MTFFATASGLMIERVRSSAIIWSLKKVGCQNWDMGCAGRDVNTESVAKPCTYAAISVRILIDLHAIFD
jgi:hypothetical protein